MIYIIWEFDVKSLKTKAFEEIYGSHGTWALLFQQSESYHGTTLLKDQTKQYRYLTIDQWDDLRSFERFIIEHSKTYEALDQQCDDLTLSERKVGIFDEI